LYYNLIDFREGNIMRKLTPEERAAKNAGLAQVAEVAEPKKKAKKAKDEPQGIGSDSFVMPTAEPIQEEAPAVEVVEEISISNSDAESE
jgi:hypothetical protein